MEAAFLCIIRDNFAVTEHTTLDARQHIYANAWSEISGIVKVGPKPEP